MKKNLVSIIILALLIVNVVLTAIMMFSVTGTANKTSQLVSDIASILSLELESSGSDESGLAVPIEDVVLYNIEDTMTISLKRDDDGVQHYVLVQTSFLMNSEHDDYSKYSAIIADKEPIIKDAIIDVFSNKTLEEAIDDQVQIKQDILEKVQAIFDSEFIFDVSFVEITPQ